MSPRKVDVIESLVKSIIPSKKGFFYYLDRCRVEVKGGSVVFVQAEDGSAYSYNIPYANLGYLALGNGTSITAEAIFSLSRMGVLVMFVGGGGLPLHASVPREFVALEPNNEYRPTEYMQAWAKIFYSKEKRLFAAKAIQKKGSG